MSSGIETTGTESEVTTSAVEPAISKDVSADTGGVQDGSEEKPAYAPNYSYKVHGQEKKFDDWIQNAIKDADTEKKVRDLYTRADGIDHVKQDRERLAETNQTLVKEKADFDQSLAELSYCVQKDDLTTFFEKLNIPKQQVLKWALHEVQMADNPALRQQTEQQRQAQLQEYHGGLRSQQVMTQYEQAAVDLRGRELDFALKQPETLSVAESFDSRVGTPGAFRNEVIARGQFHWNTRQVDMPVDQLISEVQQYFGLSQNQGQPVQSVQRAGNNGVVQGSKGKPVIPSIPSSGQSAVKQEIRGGLAGLKQRAAEVIARG